MRVVADSHAVIWYAKGSSQLSTAAHEALAAAEADGGVVVSVATLIDLWYVTQTTRAVSPEDLAGLRNGLLASPTVDLHPLDLAVADAYVSIDRTVLRDPWDRFIVATAKALKLPLVTRDGAISRSGLVDTLW